MPLQSTYLTIGPIPKKSTFKYTGQLVDDSTPPAPIAGSALVSFFITLKDVSTGTVINGWDGTKSALNLNGVTIDGSGNIVWASVPGDSPIVNSALLDNQTETHEATLLWTWNAGGKEGSKKVRIVVEQYSAVA